VIGLINTAELYQKSEGYQWVWWAVLCLFIAMLIYAIVTRGKHELFPKILGLVIVFIGFLFYADLHISRGYGAMLMLLGFAITELGERAFMWSSKEAEEKKKKH
jgi:hypothetical protein